MWHTKGMATKHVAHDPEPTPAPAPVPPPDNPDTPEGEDMNAAAKAEMARRES